WLDREGDALTVVQHRLRDCPNVIRYLDFYGSAKPYPYLVVEYVSGGSLEEWILSRPDDRVRLDTAEIMRGLARGVSAAHRHRISHGPHGLAMSGASDASVSDGVRTVRGPRRRDSVRSLEGAGRVLRRRPDRP